MFRLAFAVPIVALVLGRPAGNAAAPEPMLGVRNGHALAYDGGRSRIVLFGGADEKSVLADLWEWDGARWRNLPSSGPEPRTFPALAYDGARRRLVLFGGTRILFGKEEDRGRDMMLGDMWEWFGGAWHPAAIDGPLPAARAEASMVYDSRRKRLVLFGGYRGSGATRERLGDTWEFGGRAWTRLSPTSAPDPRNNAAMAYDEARGRVVLFGGSGGPKADTWEWDGRDWRQVDAPVPGRYNSAMAYDRRLRTVFRFGGWDGKARVGDNWFYDGRRWKEARARGPEPRNHSSMAFDERRGVFVLFGGHDGERVFGDTWEARAGRWSRKADVPPRIRVDNGH